jgi:hypothetical protein
MGERDPSQEGKRCNLMDLIEALKDTMRMEIRPNSQGSEYLEAVISKQDIELLHSLLIKHLGPTAKEPGKEANFPKEIQEVVEALGGLRKEQSFFYKQEEDKVIYAALWPWGSNPDKITLKSGVWTLVFTD